MIWSTIIGDKKDKIMSGSKEAISRWRTVVLNSEDLSD